MNDSAGHRARALGSVVAAALLAAGCHSHEEWEPLTEQKIYVADKFYDVAIRSEQEAVVIGYAGKILRSKDFGFNWEQIPVATSAALYSIDFATYGGKIGWIVGQEGTVLKTTDGGDSWKLQNPRAFMGEDCRDPGYRSRNEDKCPQAYLFSVSVIDEQTVAAIGDQSTFIFTKDGGKTWAVSTIQSASQLEEEDEDLAIVSQDPVLYDLEFFDAKNGFVVGEFGKIFKTTDGGKSWREKQGSLMGGEIFDVLDLPTFFDIDFDAKGNAVVVGLDGRIAVSKDGGETWAFEPNNVEEFTDPMYASDTMGDGTRWVVGSSGQVVKAIPGKPFERGSLGSAINSWIRRVTFHDQRGWLVGGFGLIMNTEDGGKTWIRRIG